MQIARTIRSIFTATESAGCRLLLETTAGQGSSLGHTFELLAAILEQVGNFSRIGICLDTSHIFAAGYDIRDKIAYHQTMAEFDRIIGLDHLHLIHLNDSKKALGTRVDRHEHIGHGHIGQKAFEILPEDTLQAVREKGLKKEWELYPACIQLFAEGRLKIEKQERKRRNATLAYKKTVEILPRC